MKRIIIYSLLITLISCNGNERIDSEELREEVKNRKIKRATEGEISAKADTIGTEIALKAQAILGKALKNKMKTESLEDAIKFCNVNAYPLLDSLKEVYQAQIKRVSMHERNPQDTPDDIEKQLLEAYQYNIENDLELKSNVQFIEDDVLFTMPITITNGMCLNCHGKIGEDISEENYSKIKVLYPNDHAIGHQVGDLRGMWSIRMKKGIVVQNL